MLCWVLYLELTLELAFRLQVCFLALRLQTAGVVNRNASRTQQRQVLRLYIEPEGTFIYTHWQVVSHGSRWNSPHSSFKEPMFNEWEAMSTESGSHSNGLGTRDKLLKYYCLKVVPSGHAFHHLSPPHAIFSAYHSQNNMGVVNLQYMSTALFPPDFSWDQKYFLKPG